MKYTLFLLLISYTANAQQENTILPLLDSIDRYPAKFDVSVYRPDTSLHGKLMPFAHRFEGYEREGSHVLLYNRIYRTKYNYVVNDQWKDENFDVSTIDSSKVKSITILKNRPGKWISHWGSEYLIIITTK